MGSNHLSIFALAGLNHSPYLWMVWVHYASNTSLPRSRSFALFMKKIKSIKCHLLEYCRKTPYPSMVINIINIWSKIKCIFFLNELFQKHQSFRIRFRYSVVSSVRVDSVAEKKSLNFRDDEYSINCKEDSYSGLKSSAV